MKCQICRRRKARHTHEYRGDSIEICEKCRREFFPTPTEVEVDEITAEHYGEFQAELGAGCYDLP